VLKDWDEWVAPKHDAAVAPATVTTLRAPRCEGPEHTRCFVCRLTLYLSASPDTRPVLTVAAPVTEPLTLNIVGIRRENSLSDKFDDYMAAFFMLPRTDQFKTVKSDVEEALLEDLKKAATADKAKDQVKIVHCSRNGAWVVALFPVTTDPGWVARKSDLAHKDKEIQTAETLKTDRKKLDDKAKTAGDDSSKKAKALSDEKAKRPTDPIALAAATKDFKDAKAQLGAVLAARVKRRLRTTAQYDKAIEKLQKEKQALEERFKAYKEGHSSTTDREQEEGIFEMSEGGEEGFFAEGRAMISPGHHPGKYFYFIHQATKIDRPNAHTALHVDVLPGLRIWSVKHIVEAPRRFIETRRARKVTEGGKTTDHGDSPVTVDVYDTADAAKREVVLDGKALGDDDELVIAKTLKHLKVGALSTAVPSGIPVVARIKKVDGTVERFPASPETTLRLVRSGSSVQAWLDVSGTRTQLEDGAQVHLKSRVMGTNIHRAHNTEIDSAGELKGKEGSGRVANWSEGCQTFPRFEDFNLFLRMCAVSKRWRCQQAGVPPGADCRRLDTQSESEAPGPGEQVLSDWGAPQFDNAADDRFAKDDAQKKQDLRKRRQLEAKTHRTVVEQHQLDDFETQHAAWRNDEAWTKGRRHVVWEKTRFFRADWLRACDLNAQCQQSFSYTLVELPSPDVEGLVETFQKESGPAWDGKLVP
jgi:hypothetical protein